MIFMLDLLFPFSYHYRTLRDEAKGDEAERLYCFSMIWFPKSTIKKMISVPGRHSPSFPLCSEAGPPHAEDEAIRPAETG
jgi:hypothetical protein